MLFDFKGVKADEVKQLLGSGATDEQIVAWFGNHGTTKTTEEIKAWSDGVEGYRPYDDPEKRNGSPANAPSLVSSRRTRRLSTFSKRMIEPVSKAEPSREKGGPAPALFV